MEAENKDIVVERFLDGELEGEELQKFNELLEADPEMRKALQLAKKTREALLLFSRMELKENIRAIDRKLNRSVYLKPRISWLAAASVALLLGAGAVIYANSSFSNNSMYTANYTIAGDNITTMSGDNGSFEKGMNAYNQKQYTEALNFFNTIEPTDTFYASARFYSAIIKMEETAYQEAIQTLNTIKQPKLQNEITWYRALCYLKLGQTQAAHNELLKLRGTGYKEKQVGQLLKKLDSPLRKLVF